MYAYDDHRFTKIVLSLFFLIVVAYAYFELRGILFGPTINFDKHPTETEESFVEISGNAQRIQTLMMNERPIEVTEKGEFKEPFLLSPGSNSVQFTAKDKYGNTTEANFTMFLIPTTTAPAPYMDLGTSTPPSSPSTSTDHTFTATTSSTTNN